jgi:hypothetical protein
MSRVIVIMSKLDDLDYYLVCFLLRTTTTRKVMARKVSEPGHGGLRCRSSSIVGYLLPGKG